ncbi:hypothetical protein A9264_13530 [Vibrio sp. UCD-FRSSP16_10]|uniref:GtrA family protein n=1 Tax=unclassified Vibrio TaxID=2614977 RepID=UPI000800F957|nr:MULTISPECIES: GtrA family protein [unclassified Vibrio]OBT14792.1 hypothetical protein A9260_13745 [Vibrio sp. UCD-FRSSP16_30]OBT20081.1 hypothetical protein A9264_13530 [Vibrio sp. UCD-FRSSP16_10]
MMNKSVQKLTSLISANAQQKGRFVFVGIINTLTAYLAFVAIHEFTGRYIVSSVLSYFVGMMVSYALNRRFVFKSEQQGGQLIPFCVVNLSSLACSTGALFLLVHFGGLHVYIAQVLAILVSMTMNYIGYKKIFVNGVSMQKVTQYFYNDKGSLDPILVIQWLLLVVIAVITVLNLRLSMSSNIAHDALPYMAGYSEKFTTEGRWINFALYWPLKSLPAALANSLSNLFLFVFAYKVIMGVKKDTWLALVLALVVLNIPNFTMLLKWPMTLLPGCFMLALFACIRKYLHPYTLLIAAGVLLFATYPAFYFLIPLLFLSTLRQASYLDIVKFLCVWVLGYVLGYAVANGFVYLYTALCTDHATFIHFVSWRHEAPSNSLSSLLTNIGKSAGDFTRNVKYLATLSAWFFIPIAVTALWALFKHFKYTAMLIIVITSLYFSVVPLGVTVPLRSGVTLPIGLILLLPLIKDKGWRLLLVVTLLVPLAYQTHDYNFKYAHNRDVIAQLLEQNDAQSYLKQPQLFDKVVVSVDEEKMSEYMLNKTHSHSFKNVSNLKYHYIQPYLYQFGWKESDIEVINKAQDSVQGVSRVERKERILYLNIE